MKQFNSEQSKSNKNRFSVKTKAFSSIIKKDFQRFNTNNSKMRSDDKLINFSEMIPKLLEKIKTKNSSRLNLIMDSNSFEHNSNSSELNDEDDLIKNELININILNNVNNKLSVKSPKKLTIQAIAKSTLLKLDNSEYINLEAPGTFRQKKNLEKSPSINYRKYSKESKDSLIIKLHKYFFQDGELENIDTLIKYDIYKIKINEEENEDKIEGESNNENYSTKDFDFFNIKEKVINIMDKFSDAFDNENKSQLISAMKELNEFSKNYKFDYVTQLTLDWIAQIQGKKYENCELKYIGYYNQIRDIMDKMLNELKKKVDLILVSQENKIKKENEKNIHEQNSNFHKMNSINKEELLKTKEIIPIKIDIEVNNSLNIDAVEEMLRNLDKGDLGNFGTKGGNSNIRKILNNHFVSRSDNELEAFSYPFKEDNLCYIF